jgi:hypothetical protein
MKAKWEKQRKEEEQKNKPLEEVYHSSYCRILMFDI